jgi:hypothetical protein
LLIGERTLQRGIMKIGRANTRIASAVGAMACGTILLEEGSSGRASGFPSLGLLGHFFYRPGRSVNQILLSVLFQDNRGT